MSTIVIGDIHGHADLLQAMLTEIRSRFGTAAKLYHTGDLVDRGPNSKTVVQMCIDNGIKGILGNHEIWLHQFLATGHFDEFALHKMMKGDATLRSYGIDPTVGPDEIERQLASAIPKSHREYILALPVWRRLEVDNKVFRLIHAGLKKSTARDYLDEARRRKSGSIGDDIMDTIAEMTPASVLWISNSWKNPELFHFPDNSIQVFGHSPTPRGEPLVTPRWIAVDCGCGVRRQVLGAVVLDTLETITVSELGTKGVGKANDGFTDFSM